jgi:hypothetical protein
MFVFAILGSGSLLAQPIVEWEQALQGRSGDYGYQAQQTADGGYIIVGSTRAVDERGIEGSDIWLVKTDAAGDTTWSKIFGGTDCDAGYYVEQTADDGYILTGFTMSEGAGGQDLILIKTDVNGDIVWQQVYGGTEWEVGTAVHELVGGDFIMCGYTASFGIAGAGANLWMLRTDEFGDTLWAKTFGTDEGDWAQSVEATADGGFILLGHSYGYASNRSAIYLVKTDGDGVTEWIEHYIGGGTEYGGTVHQTQDGGYIVGGWTTSYGAGGKDFYILKVNGLGVEQWHQAYGGPQDDYADGYGSLIKLDDGGFAMVGVTESFGAGGSDIWLLRTDALGDTAWAMTMGDTGDDNARSVIVTDDDGFLITGCAPAAGADPNICLFKTDSLGVAEWSQSHCAATCNYGHMVQATADRGYIIVGSTRAVDERGYEGGDIWLVKTDSVGDTTWTQEYGGTNPDVGYYVEQTADGGYILTGLTLSEGAGGADLILIKTDEYGAVVWQKVYGGTEWEAGTAVHELAGGGYIMSGLTQSFGISGAGANLWMLRTDEFGDTLWAKTFGTDEGDWAQSVEATADGGFILLGHSYGFASNRSAIYLVKTDSAGIDEWIEHYIGGGTEYGATVHQTQDGGYVVGGWTTSYGLGGADIYMLKVDTLGVEEWHQTWGGAGDDYAEGYGSLIELDDGGFAMVGRTNSFWAIGGYDIWLIRTDELGDSAWSMFLGNVWDDNARAVISPEEDKFVITGYTTDISGSRKAYLGAVSAVVSGVSELPNSPLPDDFTLEPNYPNPFNASTTIRFGLPEKSHVTVEVFNALGRKVTTLVDGVLSAGNYVVDWDGRNASGDVVSTGVYLYRLQTDMSVQSRKMILLK